MFKSPRRDPRPGLSDARRHTRRRPARPSQRHPRLHQLRVVRDRLELGGGGLVAEDLVEAGGESAALAENPLIFPDEQFLADTFIFCAIAATAIGIDSMGTFWNYFVVGFIYKTASVKRVGNHAILDSSGELTEVRPGKPLSVPAHSLSSLSGTGSGR